MLDATTTLPDGRQLGYTDLGPATAPAVLHQHGAPGSRLEPAMIADELADRAVRVITADRPGYGTSSPAPGRRLADWPADLAALADHLGLDRFGVTGYSSGGPYAVAGAALLPGRVTAVGVLAGVSDFGWSGAWDGYLGDEVAIMGLPDETAATSWCADRYGADGAGFLDADSTELTPADRAALADRRRVDAFLDSLKQAFAPGVAGFAQDVWLQAQPWAFDTGAIAVPVRVLHGAADTMVPVAHGRHTAAVIPGAQLRVLPEHGHVSVIAELAPLIADVAAELR